jgi:hypothetical protein
MSDDLRIRAIQSTMDLERQIATRTATQLAEARELLRITALDLQTEERHAALVSRIQAHLGATAPARTTAEESA